MTASFQLPVYPYPAFLFPPDDLLFPPAVSVAKLHRRGWGLGLISDYITFSKYAIRRKPNTTNEKTILHFY
jgi:hypothetical protein